MDFKTISADNVKVGMFIMGKVYPRNPMKIVSIHARGTDYKGNRFVCGYHKTGTKTGTCSFSYSTGEDFYQFAEGRNILPYSYKCKKCQSLYSSKEKIETVNEKYGTNVKCYECNGELIEIV